MNPYYERAGITIYYGDCRDVLPTLDWLPGDIVVSDPPYGTGGWRRHASGQGDNPSGSLVVEAWDDGDVDWLSMCSVDAIVTFWPAARTSLLLNAANAIGLTRHRQLIMRKPDPKPLPGGRTRWSVEPIWVLSRGAFVLTGGDDLFEASGPRTGRDRNATGHPYEKPLRVMTWLVAKLPMGRIIDPFMGSGTTIVAAQTLGRDAVGVEQDARWVDVTAKRLQQSVLPIGATS